MKNKLVIVFCLMFTLLSCDNNDFSVLNEEKVLMETSELSFLYKGEKYYSECIQLEDSTFFIFDEEVRVLFEQLHSNRNLGTLINLDDEIEYFDSYDEVVEKINSIKPPLQTRWSGTINASLTCYRDSNKKGTNFTIYVNNSNPERRIDLTKEYTSFYNAISSSVMSCPNEPNNSPNVYQVTWFDESGFRGQSLSFMINWEKRHSECHYFQSISRLGGNWNDATRSFIYKAL